MSSEVGFTKEKWIWSIVGGAARGWAVQAILCPLDVIKTCLQCSQGESKSLQVALTLFRQEGIGVFYKGLTQKLLQIGIKQIWCWPMITMMPPFLQRYHIGNLEQQAITGVSIASVDAFFLTPLERARIKIMAAFKETNKFCLTNTLKDGLQGFGAYWSKLTVSWVTFLTTQKYLRDQYPAGQPITISQLVKIGMQSALMVSSVAAPFDYVNTRVQAHNLRFSHLFNRNEILKFYRGWPLNTLALTIHSVASVFLINILTTQG